MIFNLFKLHLEFPHCFLGYRISVEKAKKKFVWPLEKIVNGKRKFTYMPKNFNVEKDFEIFEKIGIKEIWVTPKIPFMIPLFFGFLCSFIIGDIIINIINLL